MFLEPCRGQAEGPGTLSQVRTSPQEGLFQERSQRYIIFGRGQRHRESGGESCELGGPSSRLLSPRTFLNASLFADDLIPPLDLLEMIVNWILEDPRLILITFLNTPIAANLPIGFLELTPLTGLIRWCVKAPLAHKRKKKAPLANGHVAAKVPKDSGGAERDSHLLYSKLHLSVLQVLLMLQAHLTEKNLYGRLGLVLFDHMVPLVEEVNRLADELNPLNASQEIELALDRLAQALQVAMASGALLCTRGG